MNMANRPHSFEKAKSVRKGKGEERSKETYNSSLLEKTVDLELLLLGRLGGKLENVLGGGLELRGGHDESV